MSPRITGRRKRHTRASFRLRRFVPIAAQPVGDETDGVVVEHPVFAEGGHAVVAFSVKTRVGRVGNKIDEPVARAEAGQIGSGGVFVRLVEWMALGAAHGVAGDQRFSCVDERGLVLILFTWGWVLGFGGGRVYYCF